MAQNPTTEGPVKSLRQAAPGGDAVPILFAAIALLIAIGLVRDRPTSPGQAVLSVLFLLAFLVPAYILWVSARESGVFITDARVELRQLGQVRRSWTRAEVGSIQPSSRGLRLVGADGQTLHEVRYRWWRITQVELLARSAGLAPALPSEVNPRKAGDG
ncbi:MAG TPA: hypothetical protein VIN56_11655 [Candidatus Dormibacteraeota bacterium]|jgi:hypothetical protein